MALVVLSVAAIMVGCQAATPKQPAPKLDVRTGALLPVAERPEVIAFQGTDLISGQAVTFSNESEGRVRMLSFFSPG